MDKTHISIHIGQHFCIKHKNPIEALKQIYKISILSDIQTVTKIDWDFIYKGNEDSKNFILLTDLNDWSYLFWKHWEFNANVELAKNLSEALNTTVNYYFVDSVIATSRWIFADKGHVTRAHYESHECKLFDTGFNEIENKLRASINETFVEDIFWDLYEETCVSLRYVIKQNRTELNLYTGTLGDRNNS